MPVMPRSDKRSAKIAFNILGVPNNLRKSSYKKIKEYPVVKTQVRSEEFFRINGINGR